MANIHISEARISIDDNKIIVNGVQRKKPIQIDLTKEIKKNFAGEDGLEVIIKKKKSRNSNRKKNFKFECGCGNKIKSNIEELHIKCLDCDSEYSQIE